MRVVIAPDKFAGTLDAADAAAAIAAGWGRAAPADELDLAPVSDGGPGFVAVLHAALGGRLVPTRVRGPLGGIVDAPFLFSGTTAYVESARACGLHLTDAGFRDPEAASTAGVGDLLAAVSREPGLDRIVVGLGGSATTDGGRGALEALDTRELERLRAIDLVAATDVDNPLLGLRGAAAIFGPQKGADRAAVLRLDARLEAYVAELTAAELDPAAAGINPLDAARRPGAGAAGGLGFALFLLGARATSGIQLVIDALDLPSRVAAADLVLTGEGRYDEESLRGKAPSGVAALAAGQGLPCVVVAGAAAVGRRQAAAHGISEIHTLVGAVGEVAAHADPARHLADLAARIAAQWSPPARS